MMRDPSLPTRIVGRLRAAQALRARRDFAAARSDLSAARRDALAIPSSTGVTVPRAEAFERAIQDAAGGEPIRGDAARALALFELEWAGRKSREMGDWSAAAEAADAMMHVDAAYEGSHRAAALVLDHDGYASGAARERDLAARLGRRAEPMPPAHFPMANARSAGADQTGVRLEPIGS
jgi:hypothetical protein